MSSTETILNKFKEGKSGEISGKEKVDRDKELFILWASIPTLVRTIYNNEKQRPKLKEMGYPIEDTLFADLIDCKTSYAFCKKFDVGKNQPTIWKKEDPEMTKKIEEMSFKSNVLQFEKDVDFAFTQRTIQKADAPRFKLWKQVFKGWTEKSGIEHSGSIRTIQELVMDAEKTVETEKQKDKEISTA